MTQHRGGPKRKARFCCHNTKRQILFEVRLEHTEASEGDIPVCFRKFQKLLLPSFRLLTLCLIASAGLAHPLEAQTPSPSRGTESSPVLLYAPESNLERSEMEMLHTAKISVDIAMYSFTDRELVEELGRLARCGVRVPGLPRQRSIRTGKPARVFNI